MLIQHINRASKLTAKDQSVQLEIELEQISATIGTRITDGFLAAHHEYYDTLSERERYELLLAYINGAMTQECDAEQDKQELQVFNLEFEQTRTTRHYVSITAHSKERAVDLMCAIGNRLELLNTHVNYGIGEDYHVVRNVNHLPKNTPLRIQNGTSWENI